MGEDILKPGWTRVKFGEVVRLNTERCADPLAKGIERYVGLEHMTPGDLRVRAWGLVAEGTTFTNLFRPGQVLFGKRRAYQRKVAVAEFAGVCSGDIYVFEPRDPKMLLPKLLPFICQTERFFEHAVGTSAGSLSPRTNWTQLAEYEFALPPLDEQRRIMEALLCADDLVFSYEKLLKSAYTLRLSMRLSEFNPEINNPTLLSTLCMNGQGIQIGPFGAQLHQYDYVEEGIPVVMPANMVDEKIDVSNIAQVSEAKAQELSVHKIKTGDILLPRRGELNRRAYVEAHNDGWLCGTGSIRIRLDESIPSKAVFHALASPHTVRWLNGNAVGTTMPNLNTKIVARIPVALPPKFRLQIVLSQLEALETQIQQLCERTIHAKQLKAELLKQVLGDR